nr:type II toxin-antitoxin system RelE/ParE family toxin [Deinococcus peraridilitoris]
MLCVTWTIILLDEVTAWFDSLDDETTQLVTSAIDMLEERGPSLGRPMVDTLEGTNLPNLKELCPGSSGRSEIRILFVAPGILLTAGDKTGHWKRWYKEHIPIAEAHCHEGLKDDRDQEEL